MTNNGGPAFARPVADVEYRDRNHQPKYCEPQDGMSLMDYFAAAALTAYLAGRNTDDRDTRTAQTAAGCYDYAEAMIAERNKRNKLD